MTSRLTPRSRKATFPSLGGPASHMYLLLLLLLLLPLSLLLQMLLMHVIRSRQAGTALKLPVTALCRIVLIIVWGGVLPASASHV